MPSYLITGVLLILAVLAQILFSHGLLRWPVPTFTSSTNISSVQDNTSYTPSCGVAQAATQAQPFVETFQDNQRNWQKGDGSNITAAVEGYAYRLAVTNTAGKGYFLCPSSTSIGTLPENFSLMAQMTQKQGSSDAYYGLAFHLHHEANTSNVSGYAFVINGQATWAILKYDLAGRPSTLRSGTSMSDIHGTSTSNTLQVSAQSSRMSFKINDTVLPINGEGQADQTLTDSSYTGGELGILVSGPNTSFESTSIKLSIP